MMNADKKQDETLSSEEIKKQEADHLRAKTGAKNHDEKEAKLNEAETLARDKAFTEEANKLRPLDIVSGIDFYDEVQRFETHLIKMALAETGGNQAKGARLLGIKATTLNSKIKLFNIEVSPN